MPNRQQFRIKQNQALRTKPLKAKPLKIRHLKANLPRSHLNGTAPSNP
jgi:hypothetical protein